MRPVRTFLAALLLASIVTLAPNAIAAGWDSETVPIGTVATAAGVAGQFVLASGGYYHLQCTVPFYADAIETGTLTCTTTTCRYFDANVIAYIKLPPDFKRIGYLTPSAGTCNLFKAINP